MVRDRIPFSGWVSRLPKIIVGAGILLLSLGVSAQLPAQTGNAALSGIVTDPSGKTVPNARISLKSAATGQTIETRSDWTGLYEVPKLLAGDYELSVSAEGFSTKTVKVTVTEEARQTMNLTLGEPPPAGPISLEDLGFSPAQAKGSAADQALLDKRSHMLQVHQRLGLITTIPLVATLITGGSAGGKSTSSSDRTLHAILGGTTVVLYGASAYYAIFAPKIEGIETHGNIRLHKALAWVHGAGMILTPILGAMAYQQRSNGESVHGVASAHGAVAITTAVAYGLAILTESFK
jgi:hypothetical protein